MTDTDHSGPSQHYVFAHRAIPSVAFADPKNLLAILHGEDADQFLRDLWDRAGRGLDESCLRAPDGLEVQVGWASDDLLLTTIVLPTPQRSPEAWFVALATRVPDGGSTVDDIGEVRVMTLEESHDFVADARCTMMCEWLPNGDHRNHGAGPEVAAAAFAEAVSNILTPS